MASQPIPAPAKKDWDAIARAAVQGMVARLAEIPEQCGRCGRDTQLAAWDSNDDQTWLECACGEVLYDE